MRLRWREPDPPTLGDLVHEEPYELERGFRVVGVEETRVATTFRVTLERMDWQTWNDEAIVSDRVWTFVRDRR